MDTKHKILLEALRLFSKRGYDAVSVEQIASAVGIKAPSLYKHYKSKQEIFDAIFEMISADHLVQKVRSLIEYSLHDEYVSRFRRMMTIEQFRSPELSELYSRRYVNQIHDYHSGLFTKMIAAGALEDEDPVIIAMMYDAPILVMLGECDRHPEKEEEYMKKLEAHVRLFYKTFNRNGKE